jgi:hypothetical protein
MLYVAIMPYYDNMAISHIAIKQIIWPIWVFTEQAIEQKCKKLASWDPGSRGTFIKITQVRNIYRDFPHAL